MISCVFMGIRLTNGIKTLVQTMQDNPNQLIAVFYMDMLDTSYCWVSLFKEKNTIGHYTVLINHGGTTRSYNGEGYKGFQHIQSYLDVYDIEPIEIDWNILNTSEKRAFQTDQLTDIKVFWINYIERNLSHFLPIEGDYKEFY